MTICQRPLSDMSAESKRRWKASWQLMDAFETWKVAAAERQELRLKTANAFEYLYLSLGQRAIKAWQEGVSYQQKVLSCIAFLCCVTGLIPPVDGTCIQLLTHTPCSQSCNRAAIGVALPAQNSTALPRVTMHTAE